MVDINNPTPATPVTPTPMNEPVVTSTPVMDTSTGAIPPQPKKKRKSTLILLIVLLLVAAGAAYNFFFMDKETVTPVITDTTITGDTMTPSTDMTGDMMTGDTLTGTDTLTNSMDEAGDDMRKADLQQIGLALSIYNQDTKQYPSVNEYASGLLTYMTDLPTDPISDLRVSFGNTMVSGYVYTPLMRNGISNAAALLMARTYTVAGSNRIDADPALSQISDITKADADKIQAMICETITMDETTEDSLTDCTAKMGSDKLRYIYIQ